MKLRHAVLLVLTACLFSATAAAARAAEETHTGDVRVEHADAPAADTVLLITDAVELTLDDPQLAAFGGRRVTVRGERDGDTLRDPRVVTSERSTSNHPHWPSDPPSRGERRLLVLLVSTPEDAERRWDADETRSLVFGPGRTVESYVREGSAGHTTIAGAVKGWYDVDSYGGDTCNVDAVAQKAMNAAVADGVVLADFHYVMTIAPRRSVCPWNGYAFVSDPFSWINGHTTEFRLLAHELGHNLGLQHASSLECSNGGAPVTIDGVCAVQEYGDPLDAMGGSTNLFSGHHRARLNWIAPEQRETVARDGVYELAAASDASASATKALLVQRGLPGQARKYFGPEYFSLDLRTPFGQFDAFAPDDPAVAGVGVRLTDSFQWQTRPRLLDLTPGSPGGMRDGSLRVGARFEDPASRTVIELLSLQGGIARVDVSYVPSAPGGLAITPLNESGALLHWQASVDERPIDGYEIERDGVVVAKTTALELPVTDLPRGRTFRFRVLAVDADGNRTPSDARPFTTTPAPPPVRPAAVTPPLAPPVTPALPPRSSSAPADVVEPTVRWRRRPGRRLTITAADDRGTPRLEVRLDGRRVRVRGRSVTLTLPRAGRHTLLLRVTDAAGNRRTVRLRTVRGILRRA